ncbi:MAG: immunity 8 family protein [Armatimonadota bacterium]
MKATVKDFYSPDISDLQAFTPSESDCFGFLLQVLVGPENESGEESFGVVVVTPKWLQSQHRVEDIIIGRHYLIVFEYNYQRITEFIASFVSRCSGSSWDEIANKVGRLGMWEFEDYQPS